MTARALRGAWWTCRRELAITLRAPIAYVIGGLFLAVQGVAFAGLVGELSDPRRPAPLGALLEGQLTGTLLTWVLQLVVLTLLGMRTIAEDKRSGGWELLLTAQVGEAAAVVGKWLAASAVYALLWLPTLAYLAVVAWFRVDAHGWDVATIACGYLGAIALGAALLAWTVAASAATTSTLVAGALGFAVLVCMFLAGELGSLWPGLAVDHPTLAGTLAAISLRGQLAALARGELAVSALALFAAIAVVGLSAAVAVACAGRRRAAELRMRTASTALLAIGGALALVVAARHPAALDVSADRRNSLASETRALLLELPTRASLTIVEPTLAALAPVYDEVARVAARMATVAPLDVRRVDPVELPGGLDAAAKLAGVAPGDFAADGGVIVRVGDRARALDVFALADLAHSPSGPAVEHLAVEQAITGALAALVDASPVRVCATRGHGELGLLAHADKDADWTTVAARLRGDGASVEEIDLASAPPSGGAARSGGAGPIDLGGGGLSACDVVIVAGPTTPLSPDEALAIQAFVQRGGGLLVAAASRLVTGAQSAPPGAAAITPGGTGLAATGLESVLAAHGLGLPAAVAVDPTLAVRELPDTLLVVDGYAAHDVNRGFAGERATLWYEPRVVVVAGAASALISATAQSWGERNLIHGPPEKGDDDLAGPVAVAAVAGPPARIIAVGSAESFTSALLAGGASAGDLWLARAVRWLSNKPEPNLAIAARAPEEVRLVMTTGERRTVIALCTAGIPLAWLVLGGLVVVWRRRRAR